MVVTARRSLRVCLHPAWRRLPPVGVLLLLALVAARLVPPPLRDLAEVAAVALAVVLGLVLVVAVVGTLVRLVRGDLLTFR